MLQLLKMAFFAAVLCFCSLSAGATTYNIALNAHAKASGECDGNHAATCVNDGLIGIKGKGSWASNTQMFFWGETSFPWVELDWDQPQQINRVVLYNAPDAGKSFSGNLIFDDGTLVPVISIPSDGTAREVTFPMRSTRSVRFQVTDGEGDHIGLSEIEVYGAPTDYVSHVDPYIETIKGRYFFCVTGSQPYGMITAAPLTRNKNQGGGGYNYNNTEVLGFPQVHAWMLGGLDFMPVTGNVNPAQGEQQWKSSFSHASEIIQPAYHRLYLDRYKMWVEQTNSERVSMYRLTYCEDKQASLIVNLGGYVSTVTMTNAHVKMLDNQHLEGWFDTQGRLWGGPESIRIFFVLECNKPWQSLDGFDDKGIHANVTSFTGPNKVIPRNEGMSYADAPAAGVTAHLNVKAGDEVLVKMAVSYTSVENARKNLNTESTDWDFNAMRAASQKQWNTMLGRIEVKGGTLQDRVKFYTDLWHVLLGRHKIDDCSGDYPDYTKGRFEGSRTIGAPLRVFNIPNNRFHMYNSDSFWISAWNLNILWGLAYPEILDNFAASLLQYGYNGGLLPRGPNCGGYSFIMSGCPATPLITCAYQLGASHKWSPSKALPLLVRNHEKGGMMSFGDDSSLDFYKAHGYVPDNAGTTIQWAFEDWALAEMAQKMGKRSIAKRFHARSHGWTASYNPQLKLVLPRKRDGSWSHTDPLSGSGYVEANAWQATFGLSHDIPRLASLMGGNDSLCAKLNYAFEQAAKVNFTADYGSGYVSYSNQPGLSNAHVFAHAGNPRLTQYWVRQVKQKIYGGITPDLGYGGHDEDQGQMAALSALMSIGIFSLDGCTSSQPVYDITSPIFDEITIHLNPEYAKGGEFRIKTYNNSADNCYIQQARFNGKPLKNFQISRSQFAQGGLLELWMGR